jgi:hypothetical protein
MSYLSLLHPTAQIVACKDERGAYVYSWRGLRDGLAPVSYAAEYLLAELPFKVECVLRDDTIYMAWYRLVEP